MAREEPEFLRERLGQAATSICWAALILDFAERSSCARAVRANGAMASCALTGESLQTDLSFARGYHEAWESIRPEENVPCFSSYNKRASELEDVRCAAVDAASREPFRLG